MRTSSLADFSDFHTQVQATRHLGKAAITIFLHPTIVSYPGFPLSPFLPDPEHTSIIIRTPLPQGSVSFRAGKYHEKKEGKYHEALTDVVFLQICSVALTSPVLSN